MRAPLRLLAVVAVTSIAAPAVGAQVARPFQNSWFWGLKGGTTSIASPRASSSTVATIGGEWLITRTRGGLYAMYDQSSFTRASAIEDDGLLGGQRPVTVRDMRRVGVALVAFPTSFVTRTSSGRGFGSSIRPYAGLGIAVSILGSATPAPDSTGGVDAKTAAIVENQRSRASAMAMGGVQLQAGRFAVFTQLTVLPRSSPFLLNNMMTSLEGGVRYNFGSSIDR